jgi:hypothetical protein
MALKDTLAKAVSTEKYREARAKADIWRERIRTGAKTDVLQALREKNSYYSTLRKGYPRLYALLEADDRALSQDGIRKLTGRDIIID